MCFFCARVLFSHFLSLNKSIHNKPKYLFRYLSELSELHQETRMEDIDLADVWWPVLFRANSRVQPAVVGMMKYYS